MSLISVYGCNNEQHLSCPNVQRLRPGVVSACHRERVTFGWKYCPQRENVTGERRTK